MVQRKTLILTRPTAATNQEIQNSGAESSVAGKTAAADHKQILTTACHRVFPSSLLPFLPFHVYAIEWSEEKIDFFVDDTRYFTFRNERTGTATWPFDKAFHIKLNIAVGGAWGGQKGIDDTVFPQQLVIDYLRVYQ